MIPALKQNSTRSPDSNVVSVTGLDNINEILGLAQKFIENTNVYKHDLSKNDSSLTLGFGVNREDILQEVLLKIYNYLLEGQTINNLKAFALRTFNNTLIDYFRKKKRSPQELLKPAFVDSLHQVSRNKELSTPESHHKKSEVESLFKTTFGAARKLIRTNFEGTTRTKRDIDLIRRNLFLLDTLGLPAAELALKLDISAEAVDMARYRLRKKLEEKGIIISKALIEFKTRKHQGDDRILGGLTLDQAFNRLEPLLGNRNSGSSALWDYLLYLDRPAEDAALFIGVNSSNVHEMRRHIAHNLGRSQI